MLRHLHVRNLAVIAEASVELDGGLNVMTGETGAGKSLVVDSLALLAGARASADMIRTDADLCTVTGVFEPVPRAVRTRLAEAGLEGEGEEGELVIRRELSRSGRNRVFLDDQPATLRLLSEIAPFLIRIHGQREELGLVTPDLQRSWLDLRGEDEGGRLRERCQQVWQQWSEAAARLERVQGDDRLRQERVDLLRFQVAEIERASPREEEEEELRRERDLLRHSEAIREAFSRTGALLSEDEGAVSERLAHARHALEDVVDWHAEAAQWLAELEELQIRVDELASSVERRLDEVDAEPGRLDAIEERLALLERLFRKYGSSSAELLAHLERARSELAELDSDEETVERLTAEAARALESYREAAAALSEARRGWAEGLVADLERELADLALAKARFAVRLERRRSAGSPLLVGGEPVEFGPRGFDQVVFEFSPNPGEELRPLSKVASGGELARVYLALQVAARGRRGPAADAVLVFDEIDAGVGGQEAAAVGRKLRQLARGGQVLAVTHLPQVASQGDVHFRVEKQVVRKRTEVAVERLEPTRRVEEVARMLAGERITDLSRSHAEELLAGHAE